MPPETLDRNALIALLDFHVAAGVDLALDEMPHDRFYEADEPGPNLAAPPEATAMATIREAPPSPRPPEDAQPPREVSGLPRAATAPPDRIAADARALAAEAKSLDELQALVEAFDGCALKTSAKRLAFSAGVPGSQVMILGEAPGAEEDRTGVPFVGRAGQLLDRMIGAIGLDRTSVYIANIVPWRPPGNRTPTPQEVAICLPFTLRQIELARPRILLTVGAPSSQTILGMKEGIFRTRGRWFDHEIGGLRLRVLPMLHPAYLLRQPLHKRLAWRDLRQVRLALDEEGAEPASHSTT